MRRVVSILVAVAACKGASGDPSPTPAPQPKSEVRSPKPEAPKPPAPGHDFIQDAKLLYRVAACGGDGALPDELSRGDAKLGAKLDKIVARHCKNMSDRVAKFRAAYFEKDRAWFDAVVPKDAPKTVVYPFGGGD